MNRKRPRKSSNSIRRTTSLSEIAPAPEQGRPPTRVARGGSAAPAPADTGTAAVAVAGLGAAQRRHSMDCFPVTETAAFLKVCGLCNRGLGPGRDTSIYMCGEVAFCSHECRQQQMNLDELTEKKCFTPAGGSGGSSDQSGSTIAAA